MFFGEVFILKLIASLNYYIDELEGIPWTVAVSSDWYTYHRWRTCCGLWSGLPEEHHQPSQGNFKQVNWALDKTNVYMSRHNVIICGIWIHQMMTYSRRGARTRYKVLVAIKALTSLSMADHCFQASQFLHFLISLYHRLVNSLSVLF